MSEVECREFSESRGRAGEAEAPPATPTPPVSSGVGSPSDEEPPETIEVLAARAFAEGRLSAGLELLRAAAALRPTTEHLPRRNATSAPTRLSRGAATPSLFCFPSVATPPSERLFLPFAQALDGLRDVWRAPALPGYVRGEPLLADVAAVCALGAEFVEECADGAPFVLVGECGGAWVAHAVASHLERRGRTPAAVVLIDAYLPEESTYMLGLSAAHGLYEKAARHMRVDAATLTAVAWYLALFADWAPEQIAAPTLFVRGSEPLGDPSDPARYGPLPRVWGLPDACITTRGNHFTLMYADALTTARSIHDWLGAACGSPDSRPDAGQPPAGG